MINVLMAAPFNPNGRYLGGISSIANALLSNAELFEKKGIRVFKFETCQLKRRSSQNSINFQNIINFFKLCKNLAKTIKSQDIDVLYFHSSIGLALLKDLICIKKAKKRGIKTILHIHFADFEKIVTSKAFIRKRILKLLVDYADSIVFLSKRTMNDFISHGVPKEKCYVMYNFSTLVFECDEINKKIHSTFNNDLNLLFVGSIDRRKGVFDLIECIHTNNLCCNLKICGAPLDKKTEDEFLLAIGDLKNISYCGYISGEEKKRLFLESDVLVLPSYGEGLPVVILEAFSAGCSIISTKVGAISEIVKDNNGLLIDPGNINQLKTAIQTFLDKDYLSKIQKQNYEYSKTFSLDRFIDYACDIIEAL